MASCFRPYLGLWLPVCLLFAAGCESATPTVPPVSSVPLSHEPLPVSDPVQLLEKCLERYDQQNIHGYRLIMHEQERIDGRLHPPEVIEVFFRAHPFSVFMHWLKGARRAENLLYVEGENDGKMLVHPTGLIGLLDKVVALDPNGLEARASSRFSITDFGMRNTLRRTLKHWEADKEKGELRAEYLGISKIPELGDRPCYTLRRYVQPPEDGVAEETLYIDKETWFQVGTVLRGPGGRLMGEYFYRDIQLNPEFKSDQFQPAALTQ